MKHEIKNQEEFKPKGIVRPNIVPYTNAIFYRSGCNKTSFIVSDPNQPIYYTCYDDVLLFNMYSIFKREFNTEKAFQI